MILLVQVDGARTKNWGKGPRSQRLFTAGFMMGGLAKPGDRVVRKILVNTGLGLGLMLLAPFWFQFDLRFWFSVDKYG